MANKGTGETRERLCKLMMKRSNRNENKEFANVLLKIAASGKKTKAAAEEPPPHSNRNNSSREKVSVTVLLL